MTAILDIAIRRKPNPKMFRSKILSPSSGGNRWWTAYIGGPCRTSRFTVTASGYVLCTPFHLKTGKISFSETLWGFYPLTTNNSLNINRFLILSQNCIPSSSPNFKNERRRCWLSLPETMVSSQLTRRILVQAQSIIKYKGFPNPGFYKNSGKASHFKFR